MADIYGFYLKKTPSATSSFTLMNRGYLSAVEWRFGHHATEHPEGSRNYASSWLQHDLLTDDVGDTGMFVSAFNVITEGVFVALADHPVVDQYYLIERDISKYNPSTDGAIHSIDWSELFIAYEEMPNTLKMYGSPILEQGGKVFVHGNPCDIPHTEGFATGYGEKVIYRDTMTDFIENTTLNTYPIPSSRGQTSTKFSNHSDGFRISLSSAPSGVWVDGIWQPNHGTYSPASLSCRLTSSDFIALDGANPDFSASGGEIKFGFRRTTTMSFRPFAFTQSDRTGSNSFYELLVTINPTTDTDGDGIPDYLDPDDTGAPVAPPSDIIDHTDGPNVTKLYGRSINYNSETVTSAPTNYDGATSKNLLRGQSIYSTDYRGHAEYIPFTTGDFTALEQLWAKKYYDEILAAGTSIYSSYIVSNRMTMAMGLSTGNSKSIPGTDEGKNRHSCQYDYDSSGNLLPDFTGARAAIAKFRYFQSGQSSTKVQTYHSYFWPRAADTRSSANTTEENSGYQVWWPEKGRVKKIYCDLRTALATQGHGPWQYNEAPYDSTDGFNAGEADFHQLGNHPRIGLPKSKFTKGQAGLDLYPPVDGVSDYRRYWYLDANMTNPERYFPKTTTFCILQEGTCYRADLLSGTDTVGDIGSAQYEARLALNNFGTVLSSPEIVKNQWVNLQGSSSSDTGVPGAEAVDFNKTNIARLETVDGVEKRYFLPEDFKDPWGNTPNFGKCSSPIIFGIETLMHMPNTDVIDDDGDIVTAGGIYTLYTGWSMEVVYDKAAPEPLRGNEIFGAEPLGGYSLYPELEKGRRYKIHLVKDSEWTDYLYQGFQHSDAFFQTSPKSTYDSTNEYTTGIDKTLVNDTPGEGYYGTIIFDVPMDSPKVLYLRGDSNRDLANWDEPKDIHGVRSNVARYNSPDAPTDDPVIQGSYDNSIGPYRGDGSHFDGVRGNQGGTYVCGIGYTQATTWAYDWGFLHINSYSAGVEPNTTQPGYGVQDYTTSASNLWPPETAGDLTLVGIILRGSGAIPKGNATAGFYPRNIFMGPHFYHTGAMGLSGNGGWTGPIDILSNLPDGGVTEINHRKVDSLFHYAEPANRKHRYKEGEYFSFSAGSGGAAAATPLTKSQFQASSAPIEYHLDGPYVFGDFPEYQNVPLKYEKDDFAWRVSWIGTEVQNDPTMSNYAYGYNSLCPQLHFHIYSSSWQAGSICLKRGGIYVFHFMYGGGPVYLLPEYESIKNSIFPTGGDFALDPRIGDESGNISSQKIIAFQKTSGTAATHTHPGGGPDVGPWVVQPTYPGAVPYTYGYNPDNLIDDGMTYNVSPFMSYEEFAAMDPQPQGGTSLENYEKHKFKLACHGTLIWRIPYDIPDRLFITSIGTRPTRQGYPKGTYTGHDPDGNPTFSWETIDNLWGSSGAGSGGVNEGSAYGLGDSVFFTGPTTPPTDLQTAITDGSFPALSWTQSIDTTEEANTIPLIHEAAFLISEARGGGGGGDGGFGDGPHDSDQDGIPDSVEGGGDSDQDGTPDYLDTDSDNDGIPDREEGTADTDGDGTPDRLDTDSDDDGIPDSIEGSADTDGDGIPDRLDTDSDDDTIPDSIEGTIDPQTGTPVDTDQDGTPDYLDTDSDDDSLSDEDEGFDDSDGDGIPDYLDPQTNIKIVRPWYHPDGVGDFTSLQAWEDYASTQPHAAQWAEVHKGKFGQHDIEFFGNLSVEGWSSTPTVNSYPRIYVHESSQHGGEFNRTVLIGGPSTGQRLNIGVSYFRLEGIMSNQGIKIDTDVASNVLIDGCIVSAGEAVCFDCRGFSSNISSPGNFITNCLSIGHLTGTESSGPDIGYRLGGEEMFGEGVVQVFCINCSSYDQFGTGYQVMNVASGGSDGGGNVVVMNSIACDAGGFDFTFSSSGAGGNISTKYNLSSDDSSLANGDNLETHLTQKSAEVVWVNPLREYSVSVGFQGSFSLKAGSPAIDAGGFDAYTPSIDIRGNPRIAGTSVDMGPYEYIDPPIKAITLFIPAEQLSQASTTLWTSGRGDAEPKFDTLKLMLLSQGATNASISLMTGGPLNFNVAAPLYTTSYLTSGISYLYTSGKIDKFEKHCNISLFTLTNGVKISRDLIIGGCAGGPFPCPNIEVIGDDPYLPFYATPNPTLYIPGESRCFGFLSPDTEDSSAVKPRYLLEDNANDSSSSGYDWSVTGTLAYTENKVQGNKALLFPNGSTASSQNLASIPSSNSFFDSSGDGIAVSFWIKRISDYTSSPAAGAIPEGIITKSSLNQTGPNIAGINGDWGIFKTNDASESYPNIVFYANVDDISIENTTNCEVDGVDLSSCDVIGPQGFSPETGSWYFVMYWIDAKNKRSYFRYVKAPIFTGNSQVLINTSDAVTSASQKWTGNLQSSTTENLILGYNDHGLGGSATGFLGETYGDSWVIDDVVFSNQICSKSAMEDVFNRSYLNFLYSIISDSSISLYIPGPPEHTAYNEEDLYL